MKSRKLLLWGAIFLCFASIEFPGIFFINRIEPRIFHLPFIYGFTLIVWFLLCVLMYAGYRISWGHEDKAALHNPNPAGNFDRYPAGTADHPVRELNEGDKNEPDQND